MELEDCAFPLLKGIVQTADLHKGFEVSFIIPHSLILCILTRGFAFLASDLPFSILSLPFKLPVYLSRPFLTLHLSSLDTLLSSRTPTMRC